MAHDFEQERARERLTDNNLKLLIAADPPEGGWSSVRLAETSYPERELERIKKLVNLPPYARGVIVDCGRSIRILVTGTPVGDRLLEMALGEAPSFDCWVHQEWVQRGVVRRRRQGHPRLAAIHPPVPVAGQHCALRSHRGARLSVPA